MSGWVSPTGWNINLASPGPIGGTTPSSGAFTTLNASSSVTLSGGTANGVVYLDGSKVATSGSALVFDGSNLGLGATPNTWTAGYTAYQVEEQIFTGIPGQSLQSFNAVYNSGWKYINAGYANYLEITAGRFRWYVAPSGAASGDPVLFAQAMTLDNDKNLSVNGVVSTAGYTVSTLPTSVAIGSRAYVTDALTPVILTTVAGGGDGVVPVFYDGVNWIVG